MPSPSQDSQRPPFILKENLPDEYPRIFASLVLAKSSRISVKTPVYVAGFERGVLPIGAWLMSITLSRFSTPRISSCSPLRVLTRFRVEARDL